jgi:sec-independent protein translocase protein TatA
MPNIGFGEILLILVLALVIFGPKRLPDMGRSIGRSMREFRRAASDLRREVETDLDVEESPQARARSVRARSGSTGGAARAEAAPETATPEADAQPPAGDGDTPTEAPTSEADRKPSAGESTPD